MKVLKTVALALWYFATIIISAITLILLIDVIGVQSFILSTVLSITLVGCVQAAYRHIYYGDH